MTSAAPDGDPDGEETILDAALPHADEPIADDVSPEEFEAQLKQAVHEAWLAAREEELAERRASAIAAGRRKGGAAGAAMAGAMLAVAEIYEGPRKDDAPVTVEASGDPTDIDRDGVDVTVGDVDVASPPLERRDPVVGDGRKRPQV